MQKAEEVRQALSNIQGIVDLRAEGQEEEPQVQVRVNLDAAGKASVKPGDVRRSSATVFSGLVVGYLFKEQKIHEVVVWGAPEARQSLTNLKELWVEKSNHHHARLGDVADVSIVAVPTVIKHERIAPYVDVVANVVGRDPAAVAEAVDDALEKIKFPLEYYPDLLGEYAEREKAADHLVEAAAAALIGILLLLQACFQSWRLALIAFATVPAALAGGVLTAAIGGGVISLGSVVGFLALIGIAVRHGLMLIDHCRRLERDEGLPFGAELMLRGARERLTPLLTSAAAIVAALAPILMFGHSAGLEIVLPAAIVIVGGVIGSVLMATFVLPLLYLRYGEQAARQGDLGLVAR